MLETLQNISNVLTGIWNFCTAAWDLITNPTKILIGVVDMSHWILLLTAIICLIFTMCGCKKTKNGATISIVIYAILRCLANVLV
ncbi:hypothetical protein [Paraclostridium bifermentans]|uniref:hypothetical protein n=1 Tax=Paraclostridium bifermentans TaxID=1490 RepID=UPI001C80D39E|nr:hypothetical protein [Paraclostridium bifermentans]GIM32692.1 hypothetical protein PAGU1678_19620 [Paraclostridium bifermentans subsp. muricolitidis]